MNIVVITESAVVVFKRWREVERNTSFKRDSFAQVGTDYVLNCTDDTYTMSLDIKQLETVASSKVFTKDRFDATNWMQLLMLFLLFVLYAKS